MIVFVALGGVPSHTREALAQARDANPGAPLVLLHDAPVPGWRSLAASRAVQLYDLAPLRRDPRLAAFYGRREPRSPFRSGFWQHTTGRFFALRAFMEREGIPALTHLENDVLLYVPLSEVAAWSPFAAPVLATVFESPGRAIPGIVRVGARRCLDDFTDFVLAEDEGNPSNDMERLAAFRRARPELVTDLPTVPPEPGRRAGATVSLFTAGAGSIPMPRGGWLFDGARFGQYLGGIDPRNSPRCLQRWLRWQRGRLGRPNGFVNESCTDDPSRYDYRVSRPAGLAVPALACAAGVFPLATLHVHSKKLDRFTSRRLEKHRDAPVASREAREETREPWAHRTP